MQVETLLVVAQLKNLENLKVAVRFSSNLLGSMVKVTTSPSLPEVIDGCAQSHIP